MIIKILRYLKENVWKYFFFHSCVRISKGAIFEIGKGVKISSSKIFVSSGATLVIKSGVSIKNVNIFVSKGEVTIGENSTLLGTDYKNQEIIIDSGILKVENHVKLQAKRIWIRFGGMVTIGNYTNINAESEIRADELVKIGDYNQISYHVNIWDTNTHNIYLPEKRAELTRKYFPYYGYEYEKPKTRPVIIANNCWIGERASLLKGTKIGDNVIVGYNTLLSNITIEDNKKVVQDIKNRII